MLERVDRAVDAGSFAVPDPEHAIDLGARKHPDLLAAPHRGRREILIQPGDKGDILQLQERLRSPQSVVVHAERRTAIARNKSGGVETLQAVPFALQHRQSHQRLNSGKIDSLGIEAVLVVQPDLHQRHLVAPSNFMVGWDVGRKPYCFVIGGYRQGADRPSTPSRSMRSISENDVSPMSISVKKFIGSACPQITLGKGHSADPAVLPPAMIASLIGCPAPMPREVWYPSATQ